MYKDNEKNFLKQLGVRIQNVRKNANVNQLELANKSSISIDIIKSIENGEHNIKLMTLFLIAEILKIAPSELVKGL